MPITGTTAAMLQSTVTCGNSSNAYLHKYFMRLKKTPMH